MFDKYLYGDNVKNIVSIGIWLTVIISNLILSEFILHLIA